ncbi:MAG: AI-2E family transporter [Thermomicrobiales bacterium]
MPANSALDPHDFPSGGNGQPQRGDRRPGLTPFTLFLILLIAFILVRVQLVLILTLLALLFATVIERPIEQLQRRRIPRGLSILLVYVAIIGGFTLLSILVAPMISDEADNFRTEAPTQLRELEDDWRNSSNPLLSGPGQDLLDRAIKVIEQPPEPEQETAINVVLSVGGGIVGLITTLIIAFYYLLEKDLLRQLILDQLQPSSRTRVARIWDNVEAQVGRWLRGQLTLCLIIGITATIGYGIIDIRFWPLLGLWAGLTEIIPIVGPWIGGIPAFIIALTHGWDKALIVAGFIVAMQTLENAILVPRVMKGAVGLTPLTVFIAILAGTEFRGIAGAVLAIPVAAAVQVIITDYLRTRRAVGHPSESVLSGWRWMRGYHTGLPDDEPPPPEPPAAPRQPEPATAAPKEQTGWTSQVLSRVGRGLGSERQDDAPTSRPPAESSE